MDSSELSVGMLRDVQKKRHSASLNCVALLAESWIIVCIRESRNDFSTVFSSTVFYASEHADGDGQGPVPISGQVKRNVAEIFPMLPSDSI